MQGYWLRRTTRFIHDRVREHINNENSSVKKYIHSRQNEDYKGIDIKNLMSGNDTANPRLYEAFYIRKYKPTLNSREECTEFPGRPSILILYFRDYSWALLEVLCLETLHH